MFDANFIRGVLLIILMGAFLGMAIWAWSGKRKKEFELLSNLPLDGENEFAEQKSESSLKSEDHHVA